MLLKRKRSANTLTSPTTDSPSNTVQSFYPNTKPIISPFQHPSKQINFDAETPSYLSTRTRKRHRDNRPDAEAVHGASTCWLGAVIQMRALADVTRVAASTIQRLYQAQRENVAAEPGVAPGQQQQHFQQEQEQYRPAQAQKSTLHSFWRIEQPIPTAMPVQRVEITQEPRCEDCDGGLRDEGAMDVDEGSIEDKACGSCRRPICDSCAIFGRERICAGCAGCERGW